MNVYVSKNLPIDQSLY